jgi:hypothetical protein
MSATLFVVFVYRLLVLQLDLQSLLSFGSPRVVSPETVESRMSFVTREVGHIRRNWYARNYAEDRGTPWNSFLETGIARDSFIRVWKRLLRVVCPLKDLWSNTLLSLTGGDSDGRVVLNSHDDISESGEHSSLLWFREEICNHLACWTVHETDVSFVDLVLDKEIANVDVA